MSWALPCKVSNWEVEFFQSLPSLLKDLQLCRHWVYLLPCSEGIVWFCRRPTQGSQRADSVRDYGGVGGRRLREATVTRKAEGALEVISLFSTPAPLPLHRWRN